MYQREQSQTIESRIREPRKFIQVVMGPRQVGKTTIVKQALKALENEVPNLMFSADNIPATQNSWISDCWTTARRMRVQLYLLGSIILATVISCGKQNNDDSIHLIDIGNAMESVSDFGISKIGNHISYVALETTENSLIGDHPNLAVWGDKIIVSS